MKKYIIILLVVSLLLVSSCSVLQDQPKDDGVNEVNSPYVENINENIDLIAEDEVDLGSLI